MSPIVRGRAVPQIESSGRVKNSFDVLLWTENLSRNGFRILNDVQQLREYLAAGQPYAPSLNLRLPNEFRRVHTLLNGFAIPTSGIDIAAPSAEISQLFGPNAPPQMQNAAATALNSDCDMLVVEESDWYPYYEEFDKLGILLGSPAVIVRQSEIFARGHDVPWAFDSPLWDCPWGAFYFFGENNTLIPGQRFLDLSRERGVSPELQEVGRSLVFNRIPNILFTRDRLLFYEMQQAAAKRGKWTRQRFQFEIGYYLNFYYILLYGAFDHFAVLVNGVMGIGLQERDVTATGKTFLKELEKRAPEVHAIFIDPELTDFIERIAALRHATAHRSQIMPGPVYEKPDHEPTNAELDAEMQAKGLDRELQYFPAGTVREAVRESIRFKLKLTKYKVLIEDAVLIDAKKQKGFINPLIDTEWNFGRFFEFYTAVLGAVAKRI